MVSRLFALSIRLYRYSRYMRRRMRDQGTCVAVIVPCEYAARHHTTIHQSHGITLELATLAVSCEAGTTQALRGFKGLSYNGSLLRRVHCVLLNTSLKGVSQIILGPIANMLTTSIWMNNWSPFEDDAIIKLPDAASIKADDNWSLVNLVVGRYIQYWQAVICGYCLRSGCSFCVQEISGQTCSSMVEERIKYANNEYNEY